MWKLITAEGVILGLEADDGSTYVMLRAVSQVGGVQLPASPRSVALMPEAMTVVKLTGLFLESLETGTGKSK